MSIPASMRRSQAILRLPVDQVAATLWLHDGTRSEIALFLPAGDTIERVLEGNEPFVPVMRRGQFCFIGRTAVACLAVAEEPVEPDEILPLTRQAAKIQLRSGVTLEGELRWTAPQGRQRTGDHVNEEGRYLTLYADGLAHHVFKTEIAIVEEL